MFPLNCFGLLKKSMKANRRYKFAFAAEQKPGRDDYVLALLSATVAYVCRSAA
jgi:hypothetical protein